MLVPDVVAISDGGGIKQATPRPIVGADKVARFVVGGLTKNDVTLIARRHKADRRICTPGTRPTPERTRQ